jgi:hypothetical protein
MKGKLVSGRSSTIREGNIVVGRVVGAFSFHGVVVAGVTVVPMLHLLGEGTPKLVSLLDAVRNSSVESSIVAHHGVDAPLRVEPTKAAPSSPLLGERLRPSK